MENYKKICGRVSCIITIFFTFVAIICTIVMIYLVHLGKLVEKICSFLIIFSLNPLDLSREPASDDVVVMIGYKNGNTLWYGLLKERGGVNYLCQY